MAQYAIYGYVFYTLAMGMLIGSLIGIQVKSTTKVVKGIHIRGFYAVSILAGFINRAATLPKKLTEMEVIDISKPIVNGIDFVGAVGGLLDRGGTVSPSGYFVINLHYERNLFNGKIFLSCQVINFTNRY